jgi:hypothetical protein
MENTETRPRLSVRPKDARVRVAITVHFNAARPDYLAEVIRPLAGRSGRMGS